MLGGIEFGGFSDLAFVHVPSKGKNRYAVYIRILHPLATELSIT